MRVILNVATPLFAFYCLLAAAPACGESVAGETQCALTSEDYAVYSAILADPSKLGYLGFQIKKYPKLLIEQEMSFSYPTQRALAAGPAWFNEFSEKSSMRPSKQAVQNFEARAKDACRLQRRLDPALEYQLIPKKEIQDLSKQNFGRGWEAFQNLYPHSRGYWELSPVGYDERTGEALVYAGNYCGGLCGTGELILLKKEGMRWTAKNHWPVWDI